MPVQEELEQDEEQDEQEQQYPIEAEPIPYEEPQQPSKLNQAAAHTVDKLLFNKQVKIEYLEGMLDFVLIGWLILFFHFNLGFMLGWIFGDWELLHPGRNAGFLGKIITWSVVIIDLFIVLFVASLVTAVMYELCNQTLVKIATTFTNSAPYCKAFQK